MLKQHSTVLAACNADVRIAGFAGAIDNTAHNGDFYRLFEALFFQAALHLVGNFDHGVLGAAAGGAADDLRPGHGVANRTQDIVTGVHFILRVAGQGDTQRIADAFQQQAANPHAGFDQAHAVAAGFGHTHMQGVICLGGQQPVSGHHARHVGGFYGDDDIIKVMLFQQAHMVHGTFHHGFRHRGTVTGQDMLFQAAAVHANADGDVFGVAGIRDRFYTVIITDVAGVDANLIGTGIDGGKGGAIVKVDIGHNGDIHRLLNGRYHRGICRGGHRDAHDLAARFCHAFCLLHVARNILNGHIEHGLHCNGVGAANGNVADFDRPF